ncbi:DNA primase [candidate division KSB1 bacterium]
MRIPEDKIDDIRNSVNIVDVIGSSVRLKKAGKNFVGLCPFHNEKTPSFSVNAEKQIYKCFGCGEGGNVFTFLMKDQNITFYEAVRQLAEKSGISIPRIEEDPQKQQDRERLYVANEFACEWYSNNLWETKTGAAALRYLRGRGFSDETLKTFEIGCALDEWESLVKAAKQASYEYQTLIDAGLALRKSRNDNPYDRFRDRIMFPIKNQFGRIVGFGARKFDNSEGPKYINTPETAVFHKGRVLYGLFHNKDTIRARDMIIMVEGYTDVMALYAHGISLGAATCGTALTSNQAQLVNRHTKNVVLLYDADTAGVKAALRGAEVLFGANLDVSVVNLGENADPDSFLTNHSLEEFNDKLEKRKTIVDFYASSFRQKGEALTYTGKTARIRDMIDLIDTISDRLKRELLLKEIGEKLGADDRLIFKEYYRKKRSKARFKRQGSLTDTGEPVKTADPEIDPVEKDLGRVLVNDPQIAKLILKSIDRKDIKSGLIRTIIELVESFLKLKKEKYSPADLITAADDPGLQRFIPGLSIDRFMLEKKVDTEIDYFSNLAESVLSILKARKVDRELIELQDELKKGEDNRKDTSELTKKYQELIKLRSSMAHLSKK